jgi:hypothetical protein
MWISQRVYDFSKAEIVMQRPLQIDLSASQSSQALLRSLRLRRLHEMRSRSRVWYGEDCFSCSTPATPIPKGRLWVLVA